MFGDTLDLDQKKSSLIRDRVFWLMVGVGLLFFLASAVTLSLCRREGGSDRKHLQADLDIRMDRRTRPDIVDRHGTVLATNIALASLYADTKFIPEPQRIVEQIHSVFPDLDQELLKKKLKSRRSFVWIKRGLTPTQEKEIYSLGIPGLNFLQEFKRIYPNQKVVSHVLGSVDVDNKGIAGIEYYLDNQNTLPSSEGVIQLSLDLRVQYALYDELNKAYKKFKPIGVAGVIMNAHTGEIMALVSLPGFDPNLNRYAKSSASQKFNRITLGTYEMGSTVKAITLACALDSESVDPKQTEFDVTEPIRVGKFVIHDYHTLSGKITLEELFVKSSNIGVAQVALQMGEVVFTRCFEKLGLFAPPRLELPELGRPIIPKRWTRASLITASYGHGLSVSPLQMAVALASVVNGGYRVVPTIIKRNELTRGDRVLKAKTSQEMRHLLRQAVVHGTGRKADSQLYGIIGKTGTAEKTQKGQYVKSRNISSFISAFPSSDPKYVMLVLFDEPKPTPETYGYAAAGWNAAPVSAAIVERVAPILDLLPEGEFKGGRG